MSGIAGALAAVVDVVEGNCWCVGMVGGKHVCLWWLEAAVIAQVSGCDAYFGLPSCFLLACSPFRRPFPRRPQHPRRLPVFLWM